jgi:tartrate-resistant acid phosphatase type 5
LNRPLLPRRAVLKGLGGLAVAAGSAARAGATPGSGAFLALGDWGRRGERHQSEVAAGMGRAAAEAGSRFVLSAGDNFYPMGVQSADEDHWKQSFEDVYTAPALQTPWFAALGNHDYRGHPGAQIAYGRANPRWRMPARYFVVPGAEFDLPQLEVFVLDTTPIDGGEAEALVRLSRGRVSLPDPEAQLTWLKAALATSRADWKVVVGHHPIRSGGHHGGSAVLAARLEPLLAAHNVQAYICGHDHALQHIRAGGINHICTGAGSSSGSVSDVEGTLFRVPHQTGFALFALEPASLRLTLRDSAGRPLYEALIPQRLA